jgi:hypothetical protein
MGGGIEPEETPGGGVTMILTLPASPRTAGHREAVGHAADAVILDRVETWRNRLAGDGLP